MIEVVVGNVATIKVDAVVRAATVRLEPLDAVGRLLDEAGGAALAGQRAQHPALEVGVAVVTTAGALGADLVIHAVLARDTEPVTVPALRQAMRSALQRAEQWELDHVAVPPLGVGAGQLPFDDAARALVDTVREHRGRFPSTVSVIVASDEERGVFDALLSPRP